MKRISPTTSKSRFLLPVTVLGLLFAATNLATNNLAAATLGPCDTQSTSHNICIDDRDGSVTMLWSGLLNLNIEGLGSLGGNGTISGLPEQFEFWAVSTGAQDANPHSDSLGFLESADSPVGGPFSDLLLSDWQVVQGTGDTLYHGWFQSATTTLLTASPARTVVETGTFQLVFTGSQLGSYSPNDIYVSSADETTPEPASLLLLGSGLALLTVRCRRQLSRRNPSRPSHLS